MVSAVVKTSIARSDHEDNTDYESLKNRPIVGVDCGKHDILHITIDDKEKSKAIHFYRDENGKKTKWELPGNQSNISSSGSKGSMRYTSKQRRNESGQLKFQKVQQQRKPKEIMDMEHRMCATNSRTTRIRCFQEYLEIRYSVEEELYEFYANNLYRIHRMWSYNRKRKSEAKLVKRIKEKFGTDVVLAYGNWMEQHQMKWLPPSPTSGLRRVLERHFTVVVVPEYNTTKTCSKCNQKSMRPFLYRTRKKKKTIKHMRINIDNNNQRQQQPATTTKAKRNHGYGT